MIPQAPNNNRNTWEKLESYCRKLVNEGNELYIIFGPYGMGGTGSKVFKNKINNGIVIRTILLTINNFPMASFCSSFTF